MSEYHYKYNPSGGQNKRKNDDEWWQWLVIVILLGAFTPLGVFLLIAKLVTSLTASNRSTTQNTQNRSQTAGQTSYSYNYSKVRSAAQEAAQEVKTAAQEVAQEVKTATQKANQKTAQKAKAAAAKTEPMPGTMAQKPVNPSAGRGFLIAGGITTGVFALPLLFQLTEFIGGWASGYFWSYMISEMLSIGAFMGVGLVLLSVGLRRRKQAKRFRKYLGLIGMKKKVSISTLAKATRRKYDKVCDDLQNMLDQGILPVGYLDLENDKLVLTTEGIEDEEEEPEEETTEEARTDDSILGEIRAVNDSIPDPVMTAKIARIEEITGKILDYQRRYPAKAGQLRNFLNYYLPTTLKILRAYAQLEEQGIEGENISAAKSRIEGMMDKVVEGFEKQLDKLFQNDALDITSDVAVLEKMLDNDGLGDSGMTLGGH